ncbi:MAG: hypothetical protein KatS3mg102_1621 [Planctomycetota bacterium]|nr:MAG: hypothetical protein KatS3mg102_1621 [Planctomycetota bacterium]
MGRRGVFGDWFDPRRFYRRGVPRAVQTPLALLPRLREEIRGLIAAIRPRRALEIGPGEQPLLAGVPQPFYLDVALPFLLPHRGRAVQADARALPWRGGAFDLVLAADVLTHVRPAERERVLAEMARVSPRLLLFNPEPGTPEVPDSAVPSEELVVGLERLGFEVERRRRRSRRRDGAPFPMDILVAVRAGIPRELPPLA